MSYSDLQIRIEQSRKVLADDVMPQDNGILPLQRAKQARIVIINQSYLLFGLKVLDGNTVVDLRKIADSIGTFPDCTFLLDPRKNLIFNVYPRIGTWPLEIKTYIVRPDGKELRPDSESEQKFCYKMITP